jgi:hypothetical protein
MPDFVFEGFGANAPVPLTTAAVDIICRYIAAPPDGYARIRALNFAVAQTAGAFAATVAIPVFVIRGGASLGISAAAGGALVIPVRPSGQVLPALPDVGQLGGGLELIFATYYVKNSGTGLVFPQDDESSADLVARDGQKLAVCVGPLVDVSTNTPVLIAGGTTAVSLTVLGSQGRLTRRTKLPGALGESRSLPRFDIDASRHGEDSENED